MSQLTDVYYPSSLLQEYRTIPVQCGSEFVSVAVNRYRNRNKGTADAEQVKDALNGLTAGRVMRACGGPKAYVDVFVGKGSPGCVATVLEFLFSHRDRFISTHRKDGNHKGECARLLESFKRDDAQAMMQAVCSKYIGLDCNGFVGNFVKLVNPSVGNEDTKPKPYWDRQRKTVRQTADEVDIMDLIIWADQFHHVAIIDSYEWVDNQWRFNIAQSAGHGPEISAHRLKAVGNGRFYIQPTQGWQVGGPVHVISLGLYG